MTTPTTDLGASPVVSTEWLALHLGEPRIRPVDASWYLPSAERNAIAEYRGAHIPGAVYFDLDVASDRSSPLPHTMPGAAEFAAYAGSLGIGDDDAVIIYDGSGVNLSAPRVWWMFRAFGHRRTAVLDGGIGKWRAEGRRVEGGSVSLPPAPFTATLDGSRLRDAAGILAAATSGAEQIVDARSAGRFAGTETEPRPGLRGGHVPRSRNVPFASLVRVDGTLLPPDLLRARFTEAGIALDRPVVASCGSGVTACALVLALDLLGQDDASVYDGSWTEWGGRAELPVESGAAPAGSSSIPA